MLKRTGVGLFAMWICVGSWAHADEPFRVSEEAGAPSWLAIGFTQRSRFEHLENQIRAGATGDATAVVFRTHLDTVIETGMWLGRFELMDSRALATDETRLDTTIVNPLDVLQAAAGVRIERPFEAGDVLSVMAGRITIDLGSRRLVARNAFRNTINAFTGIDAAWTSGSKHHIRLFAVTPVTRQPTSDEALRDNELDFDSTGTDALLWALSYQTPKLHGAQLETYVLGLHEKDDPDAAVRRRQFVTPGLRLIRKPAAGTWDVELEGIVQLGELRRSTESGFEDLDHRAWFGHLTAGYSLEVPWTPRVSALFDYASGDANPNDDRSGRFDTLFGARRFELNPTGIYGAFARSNLLTPGLKVDIKPLSSVDAAATYRYFWLARERDAWTGTGVRDPSGASGHALGHQLEGRVRWRPAPDNVALEVGLTHLIRGGFAKDAPDGRDASATYVYTELTLQI